MTDDLAPGHVYVARGRIEAVVHDVAVVPTDDGFSVGESWGPLLGDDPAAYRPKDWRRGAHGRSAAHDDVWFVDVVSEVADGRLEVLLDRVGALLADIAAEPPEVGAGRTHLRIAMPLLGVEGGGLAGLKGDVVRDLLATLEDAARKHGFDVVLVTPEASVFAAAQHVRREGAAWPLDADLVDSARHLGDLAARGHLALFVGGGAGVPAGLPTWTRLLDELAVRAELEDDFGRLPPLDQAQLLEKRLGAKLGDHVADIVGGRTRPSLAHALLAGLGSCEVVTTNYDDLYERAVAAAGGIPTRVLPWQDAEPGHPWLLKLHGDLAQADSIVLTRRQFVRYDAATRPAGSVLQALLLTRHLLVVGASLNDDNVSRLAHEVDEFRRERGLESRFGTFLDVGGHRSRRELWSDQLRWISLPGETSEARGRSLEVFLDCVAAHAVRDQSWFLDERFDGLLGEEAQELAARARELHADAERTGGAAQPLVDALRSLGVAEKTARTGPPRG